MTSTATDLFSRPPTIAGHLLTHQCPNQIQCNRLETNLSCKQPSADKETKITQDNPKKENIRHQSEHFIDSEKAEQEQYNQTGKSLVPPRIKREASEQKHQDLNGLNAVI